MDDLYGHLSVMTEPLAYHNAIKTSFSDRTHVNMWNWIELVPIRMSDEWDARVLMPRKGGKQLPYPYLQYQTFRMNVRIFIDRFQFSWLFWYWWMAVGVVWWLVCGHNSWWVEHSGWLYGTCGLESKGIRGCFKAEWISVLSWLIDLCNITQHSFSSNRNIAQ